MVKMEKVTITYERDGQRFESTIELCGNAVDADRVSLLFTKAQAMIAEEISSREAA